MIKLSIACSFLAPLKLLRIRLTASNSVGIVYINSADAIIENVAAAGYTKVVLRPLMVVAGDHANNDMAGSEDDTSMIQEVIDRVSNEAKDDNFKVVKLKAGRYNISKTGIKLKSGIILSGEGQGPTGTVLYAYEPVKYAPVVISPNVTYSATLPPNNPHIDSNNSFFV